MYIIIVRGRQHMPFFPLACEQALLFGRAKRVSRERAARPNRRACSQAIFPRLTSTGRLGERVRKAVGVSGGRFLTKVN